MTGSDPGGATVQFRYDSRRHGECEIRLECPGPDDHICQLIRTFGTFYEHDLLRYLEAMMGGESPGLIVDVGANIGNHAVFFARFLAARVIAIEPNPSVVPILERNLRRNAGPGAGWEVVAAAVDAAAGTGVIVVPEDGANVGMARVDASGTRALGPEVPVRTLDAIVDEYYERHRSAPPLRLVKIDVEGMEAAVLAGADRTIERFAPDLVVEAITPAEKSRIDAILGPRGYVALSHHGATPAYHYTREPGWRWRVRARLLTFRAAVRRLVA